MLAQCYLCSTEHDKKRGRSASETPVWVVHGAILKRGQAYHDNTQLCADFIARLLVQHVVYLRGELSMDVVRRIMPMMPNVRELCLVHAQLEDGFLQPELRGPLA